MNKRTGLFGGSFDPVHNAHVALARTALQHLQLDELRWIPAHQPWQKDRPLTDAHHREAMLRIAMAGEPRFVLDRVELERAGASYTLDTVRELELRYPGTTWFLVIGQDQFAHFRTWHGWQELLARVQLAVAGRPADAGMPDAALPALPHHVLPLPPMAISATALRERIAAGGDISQLVPPGVASYIETHHLYAGATRS